LAGKTAAGGGQGRELGDVFRSWAAVGGVAFFPLRRAAEIRLTRATL
jgi:hypothetical protein